MSSTGFPQPVSGTVTPRFGDVATFMRLPLFRNFDDVTGNPLPRPNTLLIDSEQLEAGNALDDGFRAMAADEIVMPEHAFMLIHAPSGLVWGTADELTAMAADLTRETQRTKAMAIIGSPVPCWTAFLPSCPHPAVTSAPPKTCRWKRCRRWRRVGIRRRTNTASAQR